VECLDNCEFLDFGNGLFKCKYYKKQLESSYHELRKKIVILRCNECLEECFIGSNTLEESLKKIKQRIGFIGDTFYSFKDDFETELTEIYRIIKHLEKKANNKDDKIKLIGD